MGYIETGKGDKIMKKSKLISLVLSAALIIGCIPMTAIADTGVAINSTNFPDQTFRDYISRNFDDGDNVLSATEIASVTEITITYNESLTSLEGIKKFTSLKELTCYYNDNLTALDVSGMTSLEYLACGDSGIKTLNVNGCTNLNTLSCYDTDITSLNVSGLTNLAYFYCSSSSLLTSLNVSGCTNLEELWCEYTDITTLNLSGCTRLQKLDCSCCLLTSLDVSGCTNLEVLNCQQNNLISLDLRGLEHLDQLDVASNPIKNIYIGDSPLLCERYLGECFAKTFNSFRKDGPYECFVYDFRLFVDPDDTVYGCTQRKPDPMPSLPSPAKSVGDFVTRCYEVALGRNPDTTGYNNYLNNLNAGKACGGQVAHNFIFSQEYINKNKSNEAFVDDLYQMFFGRGRGSGEGQSWINELDAGVKDREQVFNGFVNSQEFFNLCKEYGITAGYYVSGVASSKQGGVNCFVERLYEVCLGRRSDISGQKTWASALMAGTVTGSSCVHGFLFSPEFTNKNLNDLDFVAYTYRAFFGREPDIPGLTTWMNYLGNGGTREGVFNGFVNSQEFRNLCSSYGIEP